MDVLLPEGLATVVEYNPPRRPTSATCRFLSPDGSVLASPAATVDPFVATIATVTDAEAITVSGVTGTAVAGRFYMWVSADGQEARTLLGQRDSTSLLLEWPVPRTAPEVGDTLRGLRITATIPSTATDTRGENYLIEWTTTHADSTVHVERQVAHVVRACGRAAVDVGFAKACMTAWWPDLAARRGYAYFLDLARRASDRVWRGIRATGRYLHLLWDASDFEAAGRMALEFELAVDKLVAAGTIDRVQHMKDLDGLLTLEIERVVSSRPYDEDDSGSVDSTEISTVNAINLRRW